MHFLNLNYNLSQAGIMWVATKKRLTDSEVWWRLWDTNSPKNIQSSQIYLYIWSVKIEWMNWEFVKNLNPSFLLSSIILVHSSITLTNRTFTSTKKQCLKRRNLGITWRGGVLKYVWCMHFFLYWCATQEIRFFNEVLWKKRVIFKVCWPVFDLKIFCKLMV